MNNANNVVGQDDLIINGTLTLTATTNNPFILQLVSLTNSNTPGAVTGFAGGLSYAWLAATASGGIVGFKPAALKIDTGNGSNVLAGTFSVATNGKALVVSYTAPPLVAPVMNGAATISNGGFNFSFSGPQGQTYKVLASTNLLWPLTNWLVLTNGVFDSTPANFTDGAVTNDQKYYRVVSP